jgi:hypothetical protein
MTTPRKKRTGPLPSQPTTRRHDTDRFRVSLDELDDETLGELYASVADEDRALANTGLADYARMLTCVDKEE